MRSSSKRIGSDDGRRGLVISARASSITLGMFGVVLGLVALWLLPAQTGVTSHRVALSASSAGFFPSLAGLVAVVAGLMCLVGSVWANSPSVTVRQEFETIHWRRGSLVVLWLLGGGFGIHMLGMLSSLGILTAGLAVAFGERRPAWIVGLGLTTSLAIYLLFEVLLKILFPSGWLI